MNLETLFSIFASFSPYPHLWENDDHGEKNSSKTIKEKIFKELPPVVSSPRRRGSINWFENSMVWVMRFGKSSIKNLISLKRVWIPLFAGGTQKSIQNNELRSISSNAFYFHKVALKIFRFLIPFMTIGLVSCTIEDLPELSIDTVSIYAEPDANQNSAIAVDLVLVYNQDLLKTVGKMSAAAYFSSSRQLLLDNPSLLDIWHWELVPGQIVEDFSPPQDKGDAYGGYVFANYLTPGDHRVRVAPNGIVKILLLRDDLRNLAMFNTHDVNMGTTMSNITNEQNVEVCERPCQIKLGPTKDPMQPCQRRAPNSSLCTLQRTAASSCKRPSQGKPIQIMTRPLNPPPVFIPNPNGRLR